jgi:RNA polymerase sigma-B factor
MTTEARQRVVQRYVAEPTLPNRNALISAHSYLCRRRARKFYRGTVDRADLEQVAAIGLIKASQRYSDRYDTPFEAYAWLMIVGELMHFVRDHERLVRIPRSLRTLDARFNAAYESLSARLEREPAPSELALEMGVSVRVVDELRALRVRPAVSDREPMWHGLHDGVELEASPHLAPCDIEERLTLAAALRRLSERELRIIRGIFFQERTQAQVGRELCLSQRQISRLLQRALQRLAQSMAS